MSNERGFSVGIQFTTHFIEYFFVETQRFVSSFVHVILTRQTCGQRSSRAAESKRRALGNYFSERICYMFPILKCKGDQDLGLCTSSGLAFGEPRRSSDFRNKKRVSTQEKSDCVKKSILSSDFVKNKIKKHPHPWDTHYQFSTKTLLSNPKHGYIHAHIHKSTNQN